VLLLLPARADSIFFSEDSVKNSSSLEIAEGLGVFLGNAFKEFQ